MGAGAPEAFDRLRQRGLGARAARGCLGLGERLVALEQHLGVARKLHQRARAPRRQILRRQTDRVDGARGGARVAASGAEVAHRALECAYRLRELALACLGCFGGDASCDVRDVAPGVSHHRQMCLVGLDDLRVGGERALDVRDALGDSGVAFGHRRGQREQRLQLLSHLG